MADLRPKDATRVTTVDAGDSMLIDGAAGLRSIEVTDVITTPATSTNNAAARFDSTTGKLLQDSVLIIADTTGALSRSGNGGIPVQGTNTNDDADAGSKGEYIQSSGTAAARTVTISNASPAIITDTGHGFTAARNNYSALFFTNSGGALPTGLTANTNYYITVVDANTYKVSTTVANAIAGTFVNTSSAGSGTHTADYRALLTTSTAQNVSAVNLTPGDWDLSASIYVQGTGSPAITYFEGDVTSASDTSSGITGQYFQIVPATPLTVIQGITIARVRVSISATTPYYLVANAGFSGGTTPPCRSYGVISARRVR